MSSIICFKAYIDQVMACSSFCGHIEFIYLFTQEPTFIEIIIFNIFSRLMFSLSSYSTKFSHLFRNHIDKYQIKLKLWHAGWWNCLPGGTWTKLDYLYSPANVETSILKCVTIFHCLVLQWLQIMKLFFFSSTDKLKRYRFWPSQQNNPTQILWWHTNVSVLHSIFFSYTTKFDKLYKIEHSDKEHSKWCYSSFNE